MSPAICDIRSGEIRGAKNSIDLAHEQAHITFANSELGMNLQYWEQISERATIIFIVFTLFGVNYFKWFSFLGVLVMLFCFILEEIWCSSDIRKEKIEETDKIKEEVILDG